MTYFSTVPPEMVVLGKTFFLHIPTINKTAECPGLYEHYRQKLLRIDPVIRENIIQKIILAYKRKHTFKK